MKLHHIPSIKVILTLSATGIIVCLYQACTLYAGESKPLELNSTENLIATTPVTISASIDGMSGLESKLTSGSSFGISQDSTSNRLVYYALRYTQLTSKKIIQIDPTKTYKISGQFRTISDGAAPTESQLYFGLIPYDENQTEILSHYITTYKDSNAVTISEMMLTPDAELMNIIPSNILDLIPSDAVHQIRTKETITGWSPPQIGTLEPSDHPHHRSLGFYFNGNTNKLPDEVILNHGYHAVWDEGFGPTSTTQDMVDRANTRSIYYDFQSNILNLNFPLPEHIMSKIVPGVTKIRNHLSGASYMYAGCSSCYVPLNNWIEYSGIVRPNPGYSSGAETFGLLQNNFRAFTRYVRISVLANYHQSDSATRVELQLDNLKFEEVDCGLDPQICSDP